MSFFQATFRFYEELNDFLPEEKRKVDFCHSFAGHPSIKDTIEALGVPHTEVDLILVNGEAVDFHYQLQDQDRVSVYPMFEGFDISAVNKLRPKPLRHPKFILDVHLGKLAKYLRMLGIDCVYRNDLSDPEIVKRAVDENRIVLTRDKGILKHTVIQHGYFIRSSDPDLQLIEVLKRFDLIHQIKPFDRCLECNAQIRPIAKEEIIDRLPPRTKDFYKDFCYCDQCQKIYWRGSHYENMLGRINDVVKTMNSDTKKYDYFDHEADIGIIGKGNTIEEAFVSGAEAMFAIMSELTTVKLVQEIQFDFEENDDELAFVEWLNMLIAFAREKGLQLAKFECRRDEAHWYGKAWGDRWENCLDRGTEVKGATLTSLNVLQRDGQWQARCVVDV